MRYPTRAAWSRRDVRGLGAIAVALVVGACMTGCAPSAGRTSPPPSEAMIQPSAPTTANTVAVTTGSSAHVPATIPPATTGPPGPLPGMPPVVDPGNLYSQTAAGDLSPAVTAAKRYVYVPSNDNGSVTVIDEATFAVVDRYTVGKLVQHVVPSYDLSVLYATASDSNRLVPIDPVTGKPGTPIAVDAPYNLYFTPDGRQAVVMAERRNNIDFYDPHTWERVRSVPAPCQGVNHADWSADGRWFLVTCELSGQVLKVDTETGAVLGVVDLAAGAMPQDIRVSPDGTKFFVADMANGGLWVIDATGSRVVGSIPTGVGAHAIYPSRDGTRLYVSNRGRLMGDEKRPSRPGDGSVSVVDPATDTVVATWAIPGGGSPDMGGVSVDGSQLWLTGRYDAAVYVFDTATGGVLAHIRVPTGPHGLLVWPQPGRYSLGHTGNTR